MVYLHFPTNMTEEELMLQAKYAKLRKKKKAVLALKAPRAEPEKPVVARKGSARDAREIARKLLKSGAISAIKAPCPSPQHSSFKRPRAGRERGKGMMTPGSERVANSYQPFSSPVEPIIDEKTSPTTPRINNLYDSFVSARDKEERSEPQKAKTGNTVYVSGVKISEEFLRKHMTYCGAIINISMEIEKHRGFVTFEKPDSAQKAISELDGTVTGGISLEVSLARRQPQMERINEASSSSAWSTLAASHSQKGPHRDGRSLVSYEDMLLF